MAVVVHVLWFLHSINIKFTQIYQFLVYVCGYFISVTRVNLETDVNTEINLNTRANGLVYQVQDKERFE